MNANANPVSKYTFYRSRCSPTIRFRPVFFYHLPKCGGSSVSMGRLGSSAHSCRELS
jgi:hypothetical protein